MRYSSPLSKKGITSDPHSVVIFGSHCIKKWWPQPLEDWKFHFISGRHWDPFIPTFSVLSLHNRMADLVLDTSISNSPMLSIVLVQGGHVGSNLLYLIWARHLIRSRAVTNRIFFLQKIPSFLYACATCSVLPSKISTKIQHYLSQCKKILRKYVRWFFFSL